MSYKTLSKRKVRVKDSDRGYEVYATRDCINGLYKYRVLCAPATVTTDVTSNGIKYDTYTYLQVTPIIIWAEVSDKSTAKINGFYQGLVEYVAWELENGIRSI